MNDLVSPKDIVRSGLCIGCGSCVAQASPQKTKMKFDNQGFLKPYGNTEWYIDKSPVFTRTCPFSPAAKNEDYLAEKVFPAVRHYLPSIGKYEAAFVGHVAEEDFRLQGSSGGMVTWVANELLRKGLVDGIAHVVATTNPQHEARYFKYQISRTAREIRQGAKSRYYPVELSEILTFIRETPGRYAIIGIPCFIKAVNLLRQEDIIFRERIPFTLGLFCGHMKSARFVESFAWQMNVPAGEIQSVEYRYKDNNRPANWYTASLSLRNGEVINKDWWHLADGDWGAGFFMNSACNFCDDVVAETADISFGDAWVEPYSSDGKGTNVIIVRSALIKEFIDSAIKEKRLSMKEVDGNFVEQTQAAGLRQRREGLAYRLSWFKDGVKPVKRVGPIFRGLATHRKLIYRLRYFISTWSNRTYLVARKMDAPKLYLRFAAIASAVYYGLAYHQGKFSQIKKRLRELWR